MARGMRDDCNEVALWAGLGLHVEWDIASCGFAVD
jgi:hypothetical protein